MFTHIGDAPYTSGEGWFLGGACRRKGHTKKVCSGVTHCAVYNTSKNGGEATHTLTHSFIGDVQYCIHLDASAISTDGKQRLKGKLGRKETKQLHSVPMVSRQSHDRNIINT